jgi:hypothetical protein
MKILAAVALASTLTTAAALAQPFDPARWDIADPQARMTTYLNRPSLYLYRGSADLRDVDFTDGTIEFDIALLGNPSFAGIRFRVNETDDGELIYLRPQRSRQPDSIQYAPFFQGVECWQLYNGDGFTGVAEFPMNRWMHVRLDVQGSTARLFLDNSEKPSLVVAELKSGVTHGRAGLWGRLGGAMFSNVKVTPRDPSPAQAPAAAPAVDAVTSWLLSPAFDASRVSPDVAPRSDASWTRAGVESSGLLNISRHRRKVTKLAINPLDNGTDVVYARTTLHADKAKTVRVEFGYSDAVAVFLNGRLLYRADSAFLSRDPGFLGIIGFFDALYLDLRPGDNDLVFAVSDQMGGWGLQARMR